MKAFPARSCGAEVNQTAGHKWDRDTTAAPGAHLHEAASTDQTSRWVCPEALLTHGSAEDQHSTPSASQALQKWAVWTQTDGFFWAPGTQGLACCKRLQEANPTARYSVLAQPMFRSQTLKQTPS